MSSARRRSPAALLVLAPLVLAPAARCQVAVSATVSTNYIYRGLSLSDGEPSLDLALLYDDKSGLYVGGSLIGEATRQHGARPLGDEEYIGYAIRLTPGHTLDLGVNNLNYYSYAYPSGDYDAVEVYAGWVTGLLNYYIHYSPNYFTPGARALYGEINGTIRLPRPYRLFGHVGALTPLGGGYDNKERYDLRAGIAAAFKRGEVRLAWTTALPAPLDVAPPSRGHGVVTLGLTWYF